jgi:hypothetical protein
MQEVCSNTWWAFTEQEPVHGRNRRSGTKALIVGGDLTEAPRPCLLLVWSETGELDIQVAPLGYGHIPTRPESSPAGRAWI